MFGLGFTEILLILVVALLVLGPKKLPEVSRNLGRAFGELRRGADEFRREVNLLDDPVRPSGKLSAESLFSKDIHEEQAPVAESDASAPTDRPSESNEEVDEHK